MRKETSIVTAGRHPERFGGAVNPPLIRTSTVVARTLDEWSRMTSPDFGGFVYGRHGTPTTQSLEEAIAVIEGGHSSFVYPSGLAANVGAILPFVNGGDHVLMTDTVYGPVRRFAENQLTRMNIETTFYDPKIGGAIRDVFRNNTRLVYVEAPGSLTMEMQDIPAIAEEAHKRGAKVVMDNTWATPLYFAPFEHGVDVSVQAATKYIVGHSDVMMGMVTTTEEAAGLVKECRHDFGQIASPDDVYLAQRGLRTMHVRLAQHARSALKLANWMAEQPEVECVRYPALPGDSGHAIWKRDFKGASGLFTVVLKPMTTEKLTALVDGMELFGIGASWGGYESLVMPVHPKKVRSVTDWTYEGPALRFHAGLENEDDLLEDVAAGFDKCRRA
jgi:cystathionine beta-lyase